MSDKAEIPTEIAEALKKSSQRILDRLKEEPLRVGEPDDRFGFDGKPHNFVAGVFSAYIKNYLCLTTCVGTWFSEFKLNDDVDVVHRTMGKVEAWFDAVRAISVEIRSWRAAGEYAVGRNLLASVFEHSLHEIQSFLERMVGAFADSIAAPEKQEQATPESATRSNGTTHQSASTVETEIFFFEMTEAPAMAELIAWLRRMRRREGQRTRATGRTLRRRSDSSRKKHERGSTWSSSFVLGGLAGLGLGILGDDD